MFANENVLSSLSQYLRENSQPVTSYHYLTAASVAGVIRHFPGLVLEILLAIIYADFTRVSASHMSRLKTYQKKLSS